MADLTVKDKLDQCDPNDFFAQLRRCGGIGSFMRLFLNLTVVTRTSLTSSITQVHNVSGPILYVSNAGTPLVIIDSTATVGAGLVRITYSADGVATLLFNGVTTQYTATTLVMPTDLTAGLATTVNPQ